MSSKRLLKKKMCGKKVKYRHLYEAIAAKNRLPNGNELHVYKCPECGQWHLGHMRGSRRKHPNAGKLWFSLNTF